MYDLKSVKFIQNEEQPYSIKITAIADCIPKTIGSFNFLSRHGWLILPNGTRKEYKQFQSLLNNFFKINRFFSWNDEVVKQAKIAADEFLKNERKEERRNATK